MKIFKKLLFVMTAVMTLMLVPFSMEKAYAESTNEAKIGTTEYATFSSALSAAQSGDTITLLKDVSQDFISIYDNVTIDLAGHTLTGNVSIYSNTTVKNGKLADGFMSINQDTEKGNHPTGTIQNCEFTSTLSDGRAIAGHENTKLILINVTVDENRYVSADDCDLEVNGGTFMGGLYPDNAITFVLKGTVTLSEDSVDSVSGYMSSTQAVRKLANGYYTIGEATEDDYVARVGNTKYVTLMQAVNAAKKGDTVYAIKDIDPALFQYGFTRVNKNGITINMQNHSYNGQISAACDYDLDKNNNVVSTPVTLNVYNLKGNEDTILTSEEECTLNLYNLQLGANQQYSFESFADNDNKGKINIYSGNLKGVLSFGENVVVTIMGGTYNLSTVYFNETATISVRAGKFSSYSYNTLKKYLTKYTKTAVNKDGTYTCTYVNTYGISFRGNGATSGSTAAMKGVLADRSISLRANGYKRTGYTFVGWNTLSNGKGKTYKNKASIKNLTAAGKTITLYAIWKPVTYKLSYKLNGGKNSSKNVSSYKITSSTITLKTPTRKGYTFKGWYSDSKCTKRVKTIKKGSTGNRTLYAKWSVKTYSIKYRLNGGKNSSRNPKSYKITTKSITLKTPTRKGYKFKGWYSNSKLTKRVKTIRKGSTGTRYLYAKWAKA